MRRTHRPGLVVLLLCAMLSMLVRCSGATIFDVNLIKRGSATDNNALNSWSLNGECEIEGGMFTTEDIFVTGDYDCTMRQIIDVTDANAFLVLPRRRVEMTLRGRMIGNPDVSFLVVQQLACSSQTSVLAESKLTPSPDDTLRSYTSTVQMLHNVCGLKVMYYCENHNADWLKPFGTDFSLVLTAMTETLSSSATPGHSKTLSVSFAPSTLTATTTASGLGKSPSATATSTRAGSSSRSPTGPSASSPGTMTPSGTLSDAGRSRSSTVSGTATRTVTPWPPSCSPTVTFSRSRTATTSTTGTSTHTSTASRSRSNATSRSASWSLSHRSATPSLSRTTATLATGSTTATHYQHGGVVVRLPITAATQVVATVATTAAMFLAVGAAGPALMLRMLSASSCGLEGQEGGLSAPDDDPSLYLVSPWFGDGYAMVGGNLALIVGFVAVHGTAVWLCSRCGRWSLSDAMAMLRFPHVSLQFADVATYGVCLGGWDLLWAVIRSEGDGGGARTATRLACWVLSMVLAVCVPLASLYVRKSLVAPQHGAALARRLACDAPLQSCPLPLNVLALSQRHESILRRIGPASYWAPRAHRRRFAVAFNDTHPAHISASWTTLAELCVFPVLIAAASTTRPPEAYRDVVCATVMNIVALALIVFAGAVLLLQPLRTRIMNPIKAAMMLWVALTCVVSNPAVTKPLGNTNVQQLLSVVTLLQCSTMLIQMGMVVYLFVMLERLYRDVPCPRLGDDAALQKDAGRHLSLWADGNATTACSASFDTSALVDLGEALMMQEQGDVVPAGGAADDAIELRAMATNGSSDAFDAPEEVPAPTSVDTAHSTDGNQNASDLILFYLALPPDGRVEDEDDPSRAVPTHDSGTLL